MSNLEITTLEELVAAMRRNDNRLPRWDAIADSGYSWGSYEGDTQEVWSWDTTREIPLLFVGTCPADVFLTSVQEWEEVEPHEA